MRLIHPRVPVEFFGGPADGVRRTVGIDPVTGQPAPRRIFRQTDPGGLPLFTDHIYDLQPAPPGAEVAWVYRLRAPVPP